MAHKLKEPKYISFVVVTSGKKEPKNFKLRVSVYRSLIGVLIGLFALIVLGAVSYWKVAELALDYSSLEEKNFELRKSLEKVRELEKDLGKLHQYQNRLRKSMSGYVNIENHDEQDTTKIDDLDFDNLDVTQRKTIFRNIPSLIPVEDGFFARGYNPGSLISKSHFGLDIAAPKGTAVRAPANGVVVFAGWTIEGGYVLVIEHGYGFITVYKHNERNLVDAFEQVTRGQVISLVGNTGKITSGPHLHFEIWQNGNPVDPILYVGKEKSNNS